MMDFVALPKIELHAHLSGSISRQTLHEVWLYKQKENTLSPPDLQDPLIEMPEGKHDYDLKTFFPLFSTYIYSLVSDLWALKYTTVAVLEDFEADGVVYLELRTTPRAILTADITKENYVQTILDCITDFEANPECKLRTKLILSVDRRNTLAQAQEALDLCLMFRDKGVVGIDLCGDPACVSNLSTFTPVFQQAKQEGLKITLHFAEAEVSGTEEELELLLSWWPERLGHVIHLSDNIKRKVIERAANGERMGLELCLSCNVHAGMVYGGFEGHHFGEWWKVEEAVVVLSTDDVGVFGSPLSNEYALVAKHFGLSHQEISDLARRGIDAIFGGEEEKQRLRTLMWTE